MGKSEKCFTPLPTMSFTRHFTPVTTTITILRSPTMCSGWNLWDRALYTFTDNHDEDRIASKLREPDHLFPVYQLFFTLPGHPVRVLRKRVGHRGQRTREC